MAKTYKGSLTLEWYNKQKSILLINDDETKKEDDIKAARINWVNQDEALFYELNEEEGKGVTPYWVNRNDIRIKEVRPLVFINSFEAIKKDEEGAIPGTNYKWEIKEYKNDSENIDNILIKGDNLLALNTLKKLFENKSNENKIKCAYLDPPYNIGYAFDDYLDSLEHSQWLTMMRDRLNLISELLQNEGVIVIQIDDKEMPYLLLLVHNIFGRENTKVIAVKMAEPTGLKMASVIKKGSIPKLKEYLIVASKAGVYNLDIERIPKDKWDNEYKTFITNLTQDEINSIKLIRENPLRTEKDIEFVDNILSKIETTSLSNIYSTENITSDQDKDNYNFENAWRIIQVVSISGSAKLIADEKRSHNDNSFFSIITPQKKMYFIRSDYDLNQDIPRIKILFADDYLTVHPGDFWQDIKTTGLDNEGRVELKQSKKPERLIYRILKMASSENDYILDCFGGSGTTFSVAHKMKRKWIGIENGKHTDTKIIPRLLNVLKGNDQSPLIDKLKWSGGGSFKYYHLGHSIIKNNLKGNLDFNWELPIKFLEESFLSSYDYKQLTDIEFVPNPLFASKETFPTFGIQTYGTKSRISIVSLNHPKGKNEMITFDEIMLLYNEIKAKYSPEYINIFTNRGVEIASESKPEDLEIIKIPQAIFSELEK